MKTILSLIVLSASLGGLRAASPPEDRIGKLFFPPEAIKQNYAKLGLSEEQSRALKEEWERVQANLLDLKEKLETETKELERIAKPDRVDEKELLDQLDKVLDLDREMKRHQLGIAAFIKNQLTPEQLAILREQTSRKEGPKVDLGNLPGGEARERLQQKMEQVKAKAQKARETGTVPANLQEQIQAFQALLRDGKAAEAEALLDKFLKQLDEAKK